MSYEKIAILLFYKENKNYSYSTHVNLHYANKHNYDYFVEKCIDDENMLSICTKYLINYHYILCITDGDIVFKNDIKIDIKTIIQQYMDQNVILLSNDWNENFMNSKIMILKNDPLTFDILNYWNNYIDVGYELNIAYEIYTENIEVIYFGIFENINNYILPQIIYSDSFFWVINHSYYIIISGLFSIFIGKLMSSS